MEATTNDIVELIKQQNRLNQEILEASKLETASNIALTHEQEEKKKACLQLQQVEEERIRVEQEKIKEIQRSNETQQQLITVVESLLKKVDFSTDFTKETAENIIEVLGGIKTINFVIATELLKYLVKSEIASEQITALHHALIAIGENKSATVDFGIHSKGNTVTGDNVIGSKNDIHK